MTSMRSSPCLPYGGPSCRHGSKKTSVASSKATPCLRRFFSAFSGSHSNSSTRREYQISVDPVKEDLGCDLGESGASDNGLDRAVGPTRGGARRGVPQGHPRSDSGSLTYPIPFPRTRGSVALLRSARGLHAIRAAISTVRMKASPDGASATAAESGQIIIFEPPCADRIAQCRTPPDPLRENP